jgi:hypothetical protein
MSNQHIEIVPSNVTSDGTISFKDGQPVIQFIIGEQERYLLGNSLRIVGNFGVLNGDGELGSANASLSMDGRTSIYSTIDQLVIKSQATNQTIEHIRNYNRFMASILPTTTDLGNGFTDANNNSLQVLNTKAVKTAIVDNSANLGKSNTFCLSLPCGLLSGTGPIPLAQSWGVGGLLIEIHLAPDNNVLYSSEGTGTQIANAFYQYKNIALIAEVQTPPPQQLSSLQSQGAKGSTFEYNSVSSYYTTVNSANAIINFSLGLSRVLSVFCNFITSSHINNRGYNGMATYYPVNSDNTTATIRQLVFTRGGERLPLEYNIDTIQSRDPTNKFPDCQITRNYLNSIASFPNNNKMTLVPENMVQTDGGTLTTNKYINGGSGFGVGIAFDNISNQGINFMNTNFGLNMDMDLTTDNPQSVYLFVHHKSTLVFNPTGIQVIN